MKRPSRKAVAISLAGVLLVTNGLLASRLGDAKDELDKSEVALTKMTSARDTMQDARDEARADVREERAARVELEDDADRLQGLVDNVQDPLALAALYGFCQDSRSIPTWPKLNEGAMCVTSGRVVAVSYGEDPAADLAQITFLEDLCGHFLYKGDAIGFVGSTTKHGATGAVFVRIQIALSEAQGWDARVVSSVAPACSSEGSA